jgi:hypothetical protein
MSQVEVGRVASRECDRDRLVSGDMIRDSQSGPHSYVTVRSLALMKPLEWSGEGAALQNGLTHRREAERASD